MLFILVDALCDFHTPWFDPPLSDTPALAVNETTPLLESAGVYAQAAANTAQDLIKSTVDNVRGKASAGAMNEWVKGLLGKKEWKIQCLDVLIRI